ncbi:MAG: hypothetical protein JO327_10820 [Nitrososphaeraceae archaeon]|nr:hypothetical protein [Nitrososphaeraceae archaeon]
MNNLKSITMLIMARIIKCQTRLPLHIQQGGAITTDLALQNPTNNPIKLPDTSSGHRC